MELLRWHKVCEIGGKELHRPPTVALSLPLSSREDTKTSDLSVQKSQKSQKKIKILCSQMGQYSD